MNRRPAGRLERLRYRIGWWLLSDRGREHFVRRLIDQIAEQEARARRAEILNSPDVQETLAELLATDPELGRAECARLGVPVIEAPAADELQPEPAGLPAADSEPTATGGTR